MPLQFSTSVRNAMLDAIEAAIGASAKLQIRTGAPPANAAGADTGTLLVEFALSSDWAAAAASGVKAFNAVTTTAAVGAGTAGHFRIKDNSGATTHWQGTVTLTGGGGDLAIDNTSITVGQNVSVTSWTLTAPGA